MNASGLLSRIAAVIGWLLYCFGWLRIISITPRREPLTFALFLCAAAIMLFVMVHSWIAHNKRLAAHGRRGNMTRYTPPSYTTDHLGRVLLFAPEMASAREISVSVKEGCKSYAIAAQTAGRAAARAAFVTAGEKE